MLWPPAAAESNRPGHRAAADEAGLATRRRLTACPTSERRLDGDDSEIWSKAPKIEGVAGKNRMACAPRTDHDVSIGDVRRACLREQSADALCMPSIKRDHLRLVILDHPPQAHLFSGIPNDLCERRSRNDDTVSALQSRRKDRKNAAVVSFQGDQAARVESDSVQAAFRGLAPRLRGESICFAHSRSFGVSGPPVAISTSSTSARNSAAF